MQISTKELRTHTQVLFDCLDRGETVTLTYRGKAKGTIKGIKNGQQNSLPADYPVFGIWADQADDTDVDTYLRKIRSGRF